MRGQRGQRRTLQLRQSVAAEAARLMAEQGIRDFRQAKHKAAQRLGLGDEKLLPRNAEIEDALRQHQRLFDGAGQQALLHARRTVAVEAMRFFARFHPRLVGAVLDGTADRHSAVCLHLFCDDSVEVEDFLHRHGIPFEIQTRRLRAQRTVWREYPVYLFAAADTPMDITVLPLDDLRQAPIDRSGERPMERAALAAVEQLLQSPGPEPLLPLPPAPG
jgi:hypothetical protein